MMLKRVIKRLIAGDWLPCTILSRDPMVGIAYWDDFHLNRKRFRDALPEGRPVWFLFQLGWHYETEARAAKLRAEVGEVEKEGFTPPLRFIFLCNSPREEQVLKQVGLNAVFCHQNAFLDEHRYGIVAGCRKEYDAIYVARITPFKRHALARRVPRLRLIGGWHARENEYKEKTLLGLPQARWNPAVMGSRIYREINRAHVGLCLSAEEGAMFVSAEYLLCGIPVVSTPNLGGRDELFPEAYAVRVADDADAVADAVAQLKARAPAPEQIREAVIAKMATHRRTFMEVMNTVFREAGSERDAAREWDRMFLHKWGLRCFVMPWTRWRRGLKARPSRPR